MPRKKTNTQAIAMETTPPQLRHLGGDCLLNAGTPDGVDASKAINAGTFQINKGDMVNKLTPEAQYHFALIEPQPDLKTAISLGQSGWEPVVCNDWYFSERMQIVFKPVPDGRVSALGNEANTLFIWVQPVERMQETFKENRKYTEDVGKSVEAKIAETGQKLAWAGMTPMMIGEEQSADGSILSRRETDFVTRGF
jgi:hypothetical protein